LCECQRSVRTKLPVNVANGRVARALGILFILATFTLVFYAGGYLGQATFKPQVIIEHEIHTIDRVEYKPVESVVYEPVERVIVKRIETLKLLRHFQNLDELERWLGNMWVLDIRFDVFDKETGQRIRKFDCEDYAIRLQEKALGDGYIMSFEVILPVEYNALFKQKRLSNGAIHAINSVILGNEVYYIEPQTREIVFAAYLD